MDQLSFFGELEAIKLPADLMEYYAAVFAPDEAMNLMKTFINSVPWEQRKISMYGKEMMTPRLTAWYGDPGKDYTFSGSKFDPLPWTNELLLIKQKVETISQMQFNSVLLNYYRDANDSVAWHSDDEYELGIKPIIASVSLGQVRRFEVRHKTDHQKKYAVDLQNGSVLLMKGDLQHNWEHRIPKSTKSLKERVNLTFRVISR